jgi:predicted acyl esterase
MRTFATAMTVVLLSTLFAGCTMTVDPDLVRRTGIPADDAAAGRLAPLEWKARLAAKNTSGVATTVHYLKARDGATLSLTQHLPVPIPAGTKVPTLLQLTPYQAGREPTAPPAASWRYYVDRGAAYVEADARGTNGSEGCLDFGGSLDRSDAQVFVEWIRKQSWSNGVVVADGISHPGMGAIVLHAAVPELTASLAHAPVVSYYQDEWLQGARFEDQLNGAGYQSVELGAARYIDPEAIKSQAAACTGKTLVDYNAPTGAFNSMWADRDLSRHIGNVTAPVLLTHGFIDLNVHPDHSQLYWDALPDDFPKHMVLGWWYHGWPDMTGHPAMTKPPGSTFVELRQRWLDATLWGIDNGLWKEPRVLVEDNRGTWHEGHDWPLEASTVTTFYAGPQGALVDAAPSDGRATYRDAVPSYRTQWKDASLVFRTAPLEEDRLVNGAPTVELVATSSEASTKWVVYLIAEAPSGKWERVSHGYADSHTHEREDQWLDMKPGTTYNWTVKLMPTAVVVPKGSRLALVVASQDSRRMPTNAACFPDYRTATGCYNPSGILPADTAGRAMNTVLWGEHGTQVQLAWADPAKTQKVPWAAPT